jgi:hypothetical protein
MGTAIQAEETPPPLTLRDVTGEWLAQCENRDLFRLVLRPDGHGTLQNIRPAWRDDDEPTLYEIKEVLLKGAEIRISAHHSRWGDVVLEGRGSGVELRVRISGLYRDTAPALAFVRGAAWDTAIERLRAVHEP